MGFFSRKPSCRVPEFFSDFYRDSVFELSSNRNLGQRYFEIVQKRLGEASVAFKALDIDKLSFEFRAIWLEMIGLAVSMHASEKVAVEHSLFTAAFLRQNGLERYWEAAESYNQIVAESSKIGLNKNSSRDKLKHAKTNKARMDMFDNWMTSTTPPHHEVARVANRIGVSKSRIGDGTIPLVAIRLCTRLEIDLDLNDERDGVFAASAIIFGFYQGAIEKMQQVTLIVD